MIERAPRGLRCLVVTIDTPVAGMRERDFHQLMGGSLLSKIPFLPQM